MDFSNFDKMINAEEMAKQLEEAKNNAPQGEGLETPAGDYVARIEKMELGATKDGRPMLSAMFRITEGERKKSCLFLNRVLYGTKNDANMIASAEGWLDSLEPSEDIGAVIFEDYDQFAELVLDIAEDIAELEYDVDYDPKKFNPIHIEEVYE